MKLPSQLVRAFIVIAPLTMRELNLNHFCLQAHLKRIEHNGGQLTFNPGECAGHMEGLNAIGVVDLATLAPSLLNF